MTGDELTQEIQINKNLLMNTSGLAGVYTEKVHLNENSTALSDVIIIKIIKQEKIKGIIDGIHIPQKAVANSELVKGEVISVGPDAQHEGIKVGDKILYDRLSAFYNPPLQEGTFLVTRVENVIVKFRD